MNYKPRLAKAVEVFYALLTQLNRLDFAYAAEEILG